MADASDKKHPGSSIETEDTRPSGAVSGHEETISAEQALGEDDTLALDATADTAIAPTLGDAGRATQVAPGRVTLPLSEEEAAAPSGLRFGRFVATEKVGVGGMGTVFAAMDPDLERKVAIKALHYTKARGKGQTRFLREAQAMAQLSHPNVITVHEVGTRDGQIYVVMEYVDGGTLRRFCRGKGWEQILAAYRAAGEGLIAAHELGLVHRDFKPDNVLVRKDGRVLVTDFGLVGLTDEAALSELSLETETVYDKPGSTDGPRSSSKLAIALTRTGELMGTPMYMAPEQHAGKRVDARADQYAFCVSLYEALYGVRPFDGSTYYELVDRLTKGLREPPPKDTEVPSRIEPVLVRGLSSEPDDRYPDMRALLDALQGAPERKRSRWPMALVAVGLVALGGAGAAIFSGSSVDCDRPSEALQASWNDRARAALEEALAAQPSTATAVVASLDDYAKRWATQRRDACKATHLKGTQSAELLDRRMICLDHHLARFKALISSLGAKDKRASYAAFSLVSGLPRLSVCASAKALAGWPAPAAGTEDAIRDLDAMISSAEMLTKVGDLKKARKEIDAALARARSVGYLPSLLAARHWSAQIALEEGKTHEAISTLREIAAAAAKAGLAEQEANALLTLIYQLGHVAGRYEAALALTAVAEAAVTRAGGGSYWRGRLAGNIGLVLLNKRRFRAALAQLRECERQLKQAYGEGHEEVLSARSNIAMALYRSGRVSEALALQEELLAAREKRFGGDHPAVATTLNDMGNALHELERLAAAEKALRRAVEIRQRVYGPTNNRTLASLNNLAIVLSEQGKLKQAEALARDALAAATTLFGKDSPELAGPLNTLGSQLRKQGRKREAWGAFARALANIEHAWGKKHAAAAAPLENLARIAITINQAQMAFDFMDRAIALRSQDKGTPLPELINAYALRGSFYMAVKKPQEAVRDFKLQRKGAIERYGHGNSEVARADYNLALALEAAGEQNEASAAFQRAITMLERTEPKHTIIAQAYRGLGDISKARGALAEGTKSYQKAVEVAEKHGHPHLGDMLHSLASSLVAEKKWREAAQALEQALKVREKSKQPLLAALARFELGKVLWAGRLDRKRAVALVGAARKTFVGAGEDAKGNVEEIDAWKKKR